MTKEQREWFDKKSKEVWTTGWRRHSARVGDMVVFRCYYDDYEVEPSEYPDGLWTDDGSVDLRIRKGTKGKIIQLMDNDLVKVEIESSDVYELDTVDIEIELNLRNGGNEMPRFETVTKRPKPHY